MEIKFDGFKATERDEKIVVESTSGNWSMSFSSDNPKYGLIAQMMADESMHNALDCQIILWYHFAHCMPDELFVADFVRIYESLNQRIIDPKLAKNK